MRNSRIETFDLNLLRIFDALFQHGSVNSAAEEIGVTASAISHSLGRMRHIFADELFVKGPNGMIPTARAAEIADRIAAVITQVRSILDTSEFTPELADRQFKLRCNHFISWLVLPNVINQLRTDELDISLTVQCDDSGSIADELDTGMIDLAIGAFGHLPERFESEVLMTDYWTWVIRSDHPALADGLTSDRMQELPQLVIASSSIGRSIDGIVTEAGLERIAVADKAFLSDIKTKSRYSTQVKGMLIMNSALGAPAVIAKTDLVALLPARLASTVAQRYNLTTIDYNGENSHFEHRIVWHRKHGADPAITWLRSLLQEAVKEWDVKLHDRSLLAI